MRQRFCPQVVYDLVRNESLQSKADMLNQRDDILMTPDMWLMRNGWPGTWVNSLKVYFIQGKIRRQKILPSREWDGHFHSLLHPGHHRVLHGVFDRNMRIVTFRDFNWRFNLGRKAVASGLCFWKYLGWVLSWVLLSVFILTISHFKCLPTRSSLRIWRAQRQ